MTDLFEQTASEPRAAALPAPKNISFAGMNARELVMLAAAVAIFIWGAWITKSVVAPENPRHEFVQLQLQGIISEYLQAQSRSNTDEQTAARETGIFMETLDQTVAELSNSGKVVLVHEAIIGGAVPDLTGAVREAVYSKVPRPQVAQAATGPSVESEMAAWMRQNGEGQANVQR
jgi:hypothetical protein